MAEDIYERLIKLINGYTETRWSLETSLSNSMHTSEFALISGRIEGLRFVLRLYGLCYGYDREYILATLVILKAHLICWSGVGGDDRQGGRTEMIEKAIKELEAIALDYSSKDDITRTIMVYSK